MIRRLRPGDGLSIARILQRCSKHPFDLIIGGQRPLTWQIRVGRCCGIVRLPNIPWASRRYGRLQNQCHRTIEGGTVVIETPLLLWSLRSGDSMNLASTLPIMTAKKNPWRQNHYWILTGQSAETAPSRDRGTKITFGTKRRKIIKRFRSCKSGELSGSYGKKHRFFSFVKNSK
jgi:hypothetical protein